MNKLVFVLNCGSSSIKFSIIDPVTQGEYLTGLAECFNLDNARIKWTLYGERYNAALGTGSAHTEALNFIAQNIFASASELFARIIAIGHRIAHGGEKFINSVIIDNEIMQSIADCAALAPLHNPAHLIGIKAMQKAFPRLPNIAVFDTAFHQTMPQESYLYAIPYSLYKEHGIRRYGMHGPSHYYVSREASRLLDIPIEQLNVISCHLGNGCSICAIKNGESADTSMGLAPLEGVVMGTRCGDIDPAIIFHLYKELGYSMDGINDLLTKESGLLGLTEESSDCRYAIQNYIKEEGARRALDVYTHRLAKYIAGYTACLGDHLDALIFTGGVGENAVLIRELTLKRLKILGFDIDIQANRNHGCMQKGIISKQGTPISMVIKTNEELVIAQDTARILGY